MIEKAKDYLTQKRLWPLVDVFIFVVITYGFHELWWSFSGQIAGSASFTAAASWLAGTIYNISAWLDVHIFRMDVLLYSPNVIHFNDNNTGINVNESCSGFKQMWQVLVLFLLFPGPWKQKLWYIPMGMLSMFLFNIVRIVALSFAMLYWPQHWDFIHLWVLRPIYYFIIFILWVIWVEKYGGMKRYFEKPEPKKQPNA
ncbi:MAG: archaeosortase/exosortase family protein [Bacteroidales bacterium]